MLKLPINWCDEQAVRRLFAWQCRSGAVAKDGTVVQHAEAYDDLLSLAWKCLASSGYYKMAGEHHDDLPFPVIVRYDRQAIVYMKREAVRDPWYAVGYIHSHGGVYDYYFGKERK